jgi:ferrochelatase
LGSPKSPKVSDVRMYLKKFLGDPRVVDINPILWWFVLNFIVLPFRPKKSARAYSRIWSEKGFPLIYITKSFAEKLTKYVDKNIEINYGFILSKPTFEDIFSKWIEEPVEKRAKKVLILPQFPQYSEATVASAIDDFSKVLKGATNIPSFEFINDYHCSKAFIDNSVIEIEKHLEKCETNQLVISFHGIPLRRVTDKKDLYYKQCLETFVLIRNKVTKISKDKIKFAFQSRFGREEWLKPYTSIMVEDLAREGNKNIAVYCPSFVVDCLETIDEIAFELNEDVEKHGSKINLIECLNDKKHWVEDYANFININVNGNMTQKLDLYYKVDEKEVFELC